MAMMKAVKTKQDKKYAKDPNVRACLVTGRSSLARDLKSSLGDERVQVKTNLRGLVGERGCGLIIVDTRVRDMCTWPAPLITEPELRSKQWVFLISKPSDTSCLNMLPANTVFMGHRPEKAGGELTSLLKKRLDPESKKMIDKVDFIDSARAFVVRMGDGKSYVLKVDDLPEADTSRVIRSRLAVGRRHFRVTQESGNQFDVPWDDVLYHCEPEYEYYKGRQSGKLEMNRATRIGGKIRELRKTRKLSVAELARRAGMKRPNLSRLEYGRHEPSLETLERVADALVVPVASLVAGA